MGTKGGLRIILVLFALLAAILAEGAGSLPSSPPSPPPAAGKGKEIKKGCPLKNAPWFNGNSTNSTEEEEEDFGC